MFVYLFYNNLWGNSDIYVFKKVVQKPLDKRKEPPIDWTLRTKVRFMSLKPFAWNQKLRTCEEASGITG